jgi:hypothetical protein
LPAAVVAALGFLMEEQVLLEDQVEVDQVLQEVQRPHQMEHKILDLVVVEEDIQIREQLMVRVVLEHQEL